MTRLVVGRVGRAHGLRGDVTIEIRTDSPEVRFAPGARLDADPPEHGPLTVESVREKSGRLVVRFVGVNDRDAARALAGIHLIADSTTSPPLDDPEEFWDHQLVGLSAVTVAGESLGDVTDVLHPPGGDLLVVRRPDDRELLVPFVAWIVPTVDWSGGRVVVAPPEGLLDL